MMVKRWYRSRRNQIIIFVIIILCIAYYISLHDSLQREPNLDLTRRRTVLRYIDKTLEDALKQDKGSGCDIPVLDPFAKEVIQYESYDKVTPKITCNGQDWVKCFHSKCKVKPQILATIKDITCTYIDIVYDSDVKYHLSFSTAVHGNHTYKLRKSDHVSVSCRGIKNGVSTQWYGHRTGFRSSVERKPVPKGRENTFNILIFGFDSTAKNGFIRLMPKSYNYLSKVMKASILNGYNIVGDGTPAALFPILTGKTELELPDVRKSMKNNGTCDVMPFIFYKLKDDGYRTAYFEDMPWIGTFQYRFNGFRHQPADHYLRAFYLEASKAKNKWWTKKNGKYCIGDTPQHQLMMNITDQFLRLDGKKFIFTFVADITHDDINMLSSADDNMVNFLKTLEERKVLENTLVMIMGDHGPRYAKVRNTFQGKLEERLPLMAILLPEELKRRRPEIQGVLESNVDALTTPHDIHATILDVLDMKQHMNPYKVTGADLPRGMSLLEPIPVNRSCSEAGIEPHWCACVVWQNLQPTARIYEKAVEAFIDYINSLTEEVRSSCRLRTVSQVQWVMRQRPNKRLLSFVGAKDEDGYVGKFNEQVSWLIENYQLKVVVGPGHGIYEASLKYIIKEDKFVIDSRDISRINAYGKEPSCMSAKLPHLNPYCYCKDYVSNDTSN